MFRLYKSPNGQIEQVPVNEPVEDQGEQFPDPLEAKGEPKDVAPFVLQEERQFELIKKNESDQARFQTKKLQNSNYQIINMSIVPTDSATSQNWYLNEYNKTTAVGTALDTGVLFGTNTADVTKAKYYNIVYINARFSPANIGGYTINSPSFIEFYAMQKLPSGDFGGKIPRQVEAVANSVGTMLVSVDGTYNGVQSFGVDFYNENAYYTQSPDLKGIRTCGLALKKLVMNFGSSITLSDIDVDIEIGIDLDTEGNNY